MNANILSEIDMPDGKILFIETAPGDVSVITDFVIDATPPSVEGADQLTLVELHRAFAPDREVPQAVFEAQERYQARVASEPVASSVLDTGSDEGGLLQREAGPEPIAQTSQAAASKIDKDWFVDRYCKGFSGVDYSWCYTTAWQGAWARRHSHRHSVVVCADTGAARLRMKANGSTFLLYDIDYGSCTRWKRHGAHDFFGGSVGETQESTVDWAQSTVRFAGFFSDNDNFVFVPDGFVF